MESQPFLESYEDVKAGGSHWGVPVSFHWLNSYLWGHYSLFPSLKSPTFFKSFGKKLQSMSQGWSCSRWTSHTITFSTCASDISTSIKSCCAMKEQWQRSYVSLGVLMSPFLLPHVCKCWISSLLPYGTMIPKNTAPCCFCEGHWGRRRISSLSVQKKRKVVRKVKTPYTKRC